MTLVGEPKETGRPTDKPTPDHRQADRQAHARTTGKPTDKPAPTTGKPTDKPAPVKGKSSGSKRQR